MVTTSGNHLSLSPKAVWRTSTVGNETKVVTKNSIENNPIRSNLFRSVKSETTTRNTAIRIQLIISANTSKLLEEPGTGLERNR